MPGMHIFFVKPLGSACTEHWYLLLVHWII